jgi:hypothetical protein
MAGGKWNQLLGLFLHFLLPLWEPKDLSFRLPLISRETPEEASEELMSFEGNDI